jgi:hypothetical protein
LATILEKIRFCCQSWQHFLEKAESVDRFFLNRGGAEDAEILCSRGVFAVRKKLNVES